MADGALWNRYWDRTYWHQWESLGGELDPPRRPPRRRAPTALTCSPAGRANLAPLRDGTQWVPWEHLPGF